MTAPPFAGADWQGRADELQALGLAWLEQGRFDDAARLLLDALALHEAHGDDDGALPLATYLGVALYEHGKLEQAVSIWEEVLARGWKLPTVYALLERHYAREGQPEAAERVRQAAASAAETNDTQGEAGTPASMAPTVDPDSAHRILLADDESGVRSLVTRFLEGTGYAVEEAVDGAAALEAIMAQPPAVAILDVYMPRMSGLDVLLKMREEGIDTPVIVVSGFPEDELVEAVVQHGAIFLSKPISLQELRRLVEANVALVDAGMR